MALHQKTLDRLKELNIRNEALTQQLQSLNPAKAADTKPAERSEAPQALLPNQFQESDVRKEQSTEQSAPTGPRTGLLKSLKTRLAHDHLAVRSARTQYAGNVSCRNCGYPIYRATTICQRCGAQFGKLVCPCGRELTPSDRFCDRCGRSIGAI